MTKEMGKDFPLKPDNPQSLCGPAQKWVFDALGNVLLSGSLQVKGWIDPTWLQLDNQTSSTGIPNNSLYTLSNVYTFKNSSGAAKTIAENTAGVRCRANSSDGTTAVGSNTTIISESISPASTSNKVLIIAGYYGTTDTTPNGTPKIELVRSPSTVVSTITEDNEGVNGIRTFGGVIMGLDSPSTTSSTTYLLRMNDTQTGTWTVQGSSIALIEVTET